MKCRYVGDSCCEFPAEFLENHDCMRIPLTIWVGEEEFIDDESFDQALFLKKVAAYPKWPRSACPSPEQFMEAFKGDWDIIFVSTLSADLSGSFNSAVLAKSLFESSRAARPDTNKDYGETPFGEKKAPLIHVFNSRSASCGEAQVLMKAASLIESGHSFEDTVRLTEDFLYNDLKTYFVLQDMEALRKNGRLTRMQALAATALNIKPVCFGNRGIIEQAALARGTKKALEKMVDISLKEVNDTSDRILFISHCNCPERAEAVREIYLKKASFLKSLIIDQAGISSLYASDGGIIATF